MAIFDERKKQFSPIQSKLIFAGYQVNEQNVKEMLQFMGVKPTDEIVQEAIGWMSQNAMEINMINLYNFIKEKSLDKNRIDLRLKKN